jgi:rubrerythrin
MFLRQIAGVLITDCVRHPWTRQQVTRLYRTGAVQALSFAYARGYQAGRYAAMNERMDGLHEWKCPSCGATTRARMADQ